MRVFFLGSWLTAIGVAISPIVYFMLFGWFAREAEFADKVRNAADMDQYFQRFWSKGRYVYLQEHARHRQIMDRSAGVLTDPLAVDQTVSTRPQTLPDETKAAVAHREIEERFDVLRQMFKVRYQVLIGRGRYAWPLLLFFVVVSLLSGLVVQTALRTGYDQYVAYYEGEAQLEKTAHAAGVNIHEPIDLPRTGLAEFDRDFWPLPAIELSLPALLAIAGAYLFIVAQLIQQCRARTLVYSDLFGASLRLLMAVPLGMSVAITGTGKELIGSFVAFGIGAFPIRDLTAVVRRLVGKYVGFDAGAAEDQTTAMIGVTQAVADVLAEENITCAQQLADIDPVVLAIRTGLSFDYVLFLAAQSLVWCFLGKTAGLLGPLGFADARAIWYLMHGPPATRDAVLASLEARITAQIVGGTSPGCAIDAILLRQAFEKIAIDPYTIFLVQFTSDRVSAAPGPQPQKQLPPVGTP